MADNSSDSSANEKGGNDVHLHNVVSITEDQIGTTEVITSIISPSGKEVQITGDVDQAMALALKTEGMVIDDMTNKRVLRKIDLCLLPLLMLLYSIQFVDKNSNSYSSVMGLQEDLGMIGNQYSWTGTSFYLGYLVFVFPASYLIQKFPMAKTTSVFIVLWGIVVCLCATPNYQGFIALRTILGMLESSITPAMMILTSQWYKKEEQFLRTSMWLSFNGLGTIIGSSLAYGLLIHSESYSIELWKLLFIITGLISILVGVLFFLHIPDTPDKAWWLSEEEKMVVVERIRTNNQGFGNRHFKKHQFIEAFSDVNTYLLFLFGIAQNVTNGLLGSFSSILLKEDFGYTSQKTLLMGLPKGPVEVFGCIGAAYSVRFFKHRLLISTFISLLTIVFSCMLAFCDDNKKLKLLGMYLLDLLVVGMICAISISSSNVAGLTKKSLVNAVYLVGYCVGNLVGPQTFRADQAPHYTGAKISMVACYSASTLFILLLYANTWRRNVKRTKQREARGGQDDKHFENMEFADLTDFENPNFVYSL